MKNNVLGQVLKVNFDLSPELVKAVVSVNGTKLTWSGDLTAEETKQLRFIVGRVTGGQVESEGGENLFAELALFGDAVQRQLAEIEGLRSALETANQMEQSLIAKRDELEQAISNQREVIDRLRGQVAEGFHKETTPIETPALIEPIEFQLANNEAERDTVSPSSSIPENHVGA